jgi:hypothetical protein
VNDQKNQLHLFPQDLAELNTTYTESVIIGKKTRMRDSLYMEATSSAIYVKSTGGANSRTSLDFEDDAEQIYDMEYADLLKRQEVGIGMSEPHRMCLLSNGRLGIGTTTPRTTLEVNGNVSQTTVPFGTNTYSYNVSNNTWTNNGGGPFSYSVCAWINGSIYVNNSIYNASDRRLKEATN